MLRKCSILVHIAMILAVPVTRYADNLIGEADYGDTVSALAADAHSKCLIPAPEYENLKSPPFSGPLEGDWMRNTTSQGKHKFQLHISRDPQKCSSLWGSSHGTLLFEPGQTYRGNCHGWCGKTFRDTNVPVPGGGCEDGTNCLFFYVSGHQPCHVLVINVRESGYTSVQLLQIMLSSVKLWIAA